MPTDREFLTAIKKGNHYQGRNLEREGYARLGAGNNKMKMNDLRAKTDDGFKQHSRSKTE